MGDDLSSIWRSGLAPGSIDREDGIELVPLSLWVIRRHRRCVDRCPLCPRKRTLVERAVMSALCQKRTLIWLKDAPRRAGKWTPVFGKDRARGRNSSGNLAIFTAIRRASSLVSWDLCDRPGSRRRFSRGGRLNVVVEILRLVEAEAVLRSCTIPRATISGVERNEVNPK